MLIGGLKGKVVGSTTDLFAHGPLPPGDNQRVG